MPFVQRVVSPKFVSRVVLHDEEGKPKIKDGELEAVTNFTLSSALRQLASVVLIANNIFEGLSKQLEDVSERTGRLRGRIDVVNRLVEAYDPKMVTVPESDLTRFSCLSSHFDSARPPATGLFTPDTRPSPVRALYAMAAPTPVRVIRALDRHRRDGSRSSRYFSVTPVLGGPKRRRVLTDIETRVPDQVSRLRRWTSLEALGDMTADLDCTSRLHMAADATDDVVDHRLPSPEEQLQALALKFPSEMVSVDVSGRSFNRMSHLRRSMVQPGETSARRTRTRRARGKRRNTIAGTDTGLELAAIVGVSSEGNLCGVTPEPEKKSHLESLKEWGLRLLRPEAVRLRERSGSGGGGRRKWDQEPTPHSSSGNWSASSESGSTATSHHPRSSVSSGSVCQKHGRRPTGVSTSSSVTSESTITPDLDGETCSTYSCDTEGYYTSFHLDSGLKTLREEEPLPALQSMSALSASRGLTADSEYELFGKGSTSTTASSAGTVCTMLVNPPAPSVPERVNSQLSSSLPERGVKALHSLGKEANLSVKKETSSLKMEKKSPVNVDLKKLYDNKSNLTKENLAKKDAEEKKGLITVEVHHGQEGPEKGGDSPDSGHNTCSSPVDSITSPSIDLEMSECSDLEGIDRVERIRVKTTINSSRIPSMCVITPPASDDEVSLHALRGPVDMGEYVTISDTSSPGTISPIVRESEYVSLNELPNDSLERKQRQGARVTLDSEGKVVFSSESLRRRKAIHTTQSFEPGPNVVTVTSPVMPRVTHIRPVVSNGSAQIRSHSPSPTRIIMSNRPQSPAVANGSAKLETESSSQPRKPLSPVSSNRAISPQASTDRNSMSRGRSQQYFPKSSYGRMSPSPSSKPLSPLASPTGTNQKAPGSRPMSPPIYPSSRSVSPKMVVRAKQIARAVSPTAQRGAYVKVQDSTDGDDLKNVLKRSDSYRMANEDTAVKPFKSPPVVTIAGPNLLAAIQTARPGKDNPPPQAGPASLQCSTPTKANHANLDFSTNLSPIQPQATASNVNAPATNGRTAMDLYAIIHESKKKIMKLRERNASPKLTEKFSKMQQANNSIQAALEKQRALNKVNLPISESVLKMNSRSSTPEGVTRQMPQMIAPRSNTPEGICSRNVPGSEDRLPQRVDSRSNTPEGAYARNAPGSGCSTPERNIRVISEGPHWPKVIPVSQVPILPRSSPSPCPSPTYDFLNISPSGHYQKTRSPSPQMDPSQFPSYPDYRSLPRVRRDTPRNSPTHFLPQSPGRPGPSAQTWDRRLLSPQHSTFASDRHGRTQPTSRNDFKQLLLRKNFGTATSSGSAVERLKNRASASPVKNRSWKSDILSSTIPEDCGEEEYQSESIPKSSALVKRQSKDFDKNRVSPTLETAL